MFGTMFQKKTQSEEELSQSNISVRSPEELEQLEKMIKVGPVTFIFVHADWCGHCQTYKPIWNELLNVPGRSANMGMIHHDIVEKSSILNKAKIPGYPTVLKVYPNGHIENYKGQNNEMTNAVPNMRDTESMKKELLSLPVINVTDLSQTNAAKKANTPADVMIKSFVLANRVNNKTDNKTNNITKMTKSNVVNTLLRKTNKKSLKSNLLKSLDNILENNKKTLKDNKKKTKNNNNLLMTTYAVTQKTKRNIQNKAPSISLGTTAVAPKMNEISIGATRIVPPMRGGSLFVALTQAVQQAGPVAALLLANAALPVSPKKSHGSTMRLTRKSKNRKKYLIYHLSSSTYKSMTLA
jgi:thiol-disulfide isomerase/thioredoxin